MMRESCSEALLDGSVGRTGASISYRLRVPLHIPVNVRQMGGDRAHFRRPVGEFDYDLGRSHTGSSDVFDMAGADRSRRNRVGVFQGVSSLRFHPLKPPCGDGLAPFY